MSLRLGMRNTILEQLIPLLISIDCRPISLCSVLFQHFAREEVLQLELGRTEGTIQGFQSFSLLWKSCICVFVSCIQKNKVNIFVRKFESEYLLKNSETGPHRIFFQMKTKKSKIAFL